MSKPNIILIMADDMGYGDFECVNQGLNSTPNLIRLYHESMRVSQGYAASCVCAPSRAGFLTGRYPHRTGCTCLNDYNGLNQLEPSEVTIGDIFKNAGYHTGLIGKWHCGENRGSRPEDRGFTEVETFHPQGCDYWDWRIDENGTEIQSNGRYLTDYLTERTVEFIKRNQDKPFFLHLGYYTPHRPLQAPQHLIDKYMARGDLTLGEAVVYAMIEVMDQGIGKINETLEQLGMVENTIVIFTSDNGPDDHEVNGLSPVRFNCGLRGNKYFVHDGGIRVPFLVRWPERIAPDSENNDLFHFVDILPTLAAACNVEIPAGLCVDGQNKLASWLGQSGGICEARFWQWNRYYPSDECNAAMREGDWKLVIPARSGFREMAAENVEMVLGKRPFVRTRPKMPELGPVSAPMLFNIADDPCEKHDLSANYAHRARDMHKRLNQWFYSVRRELDIVIENRFE